MEQQGNNREAFLMVTAGSKGTGKTWETMHVLQDYVTDNIQTKVKGRKAVVIDVNGEYTKEQFARNGIANFDVKKIAVEDVPKFAQSNVIEARRIDMKNLMIKDKLEVLKFVIQKMRNGLMIIEDINNMTLNITHLEEIIGVIISARHRGLDIIVSYQSLRPVEPRLWQNANYIRFHYCLDNVSDIKGKVPNPEILKISQLLINNKYYSGDKRFKLYVDMYGNKIEGPFTDKDFREAAIQYLNTNKRILTEYRDMNGLAKSTKLGVTTDPAIEGCITMLKGRYLSA